ncbi:hypothetical protein SDC9_140947 [bioreactor metagenome]|uniref:Uncharacterized protein n=1 Tax=bioreactor metagenome TaxID=1076179 RepID=A0A645DWX4_9ZZZZ
MIAGLLRRYVDVFADFDCPFRSGDERTAIAPRSKPVRREPINFEDEGRAIVSDQRGIAVILQFRRSRIVVVSDLTVQHVGIGISRIVEELLDLMAADVGQNTAVLFFLEEPIRTFLFIQAMRSKTRHLDDAADPSLFDQLAGKHSAFHMQSFAEIYPIFFAGLGHYFFGLFQLLKCREAGLVGEVVFPCPHDAVAQSAAQIRNGRSRNQLDLWIFQDLLQGLSNGNIRE